LTLCWREHNQAGKKLKILVCDNLTKFWNDIDDQNFLLATVITTLKNDIVLILKLEKFEKRPKIANDDDNTWRPCLFFWQLKCKPRNSKITINGRTANLNSNFQGQLLSKTNMYLYLISVFTLFCPLSWTRSNLRYQFIMRCK
jgi:hypothetical protein